MLCRCDSDSGSQFSLQAEDGSWQAGVAFSSLGCSKQYGERFRVVGSCGPAGEQQRVEVSQGDILAHVTCSYHWLQVGFQTESEFYWAFTSCHDPVRANNLWVEHRNKDHFIISTNSDCSNTQRAGQRGLKRQQQRPAELH